MVDDEEAVEQAASKSRHREEVHGRNGFTMIAQESCPSPCRLGVPGSLPHPPQNGSFRNLEPKHLQFAMNSGRTPSTVLPDHLVDQLAKFQAGRFAPYRNMFTGKAFPIQPGSGPMPTDDGVGLNEDQSFSPSGPQPT